MTSRTRNRVGALSLAVVACATYAQSLFVGFFSDDYQWLGRMNATLEQPTYVFTVFFRDFNPVLHASFALDWIIGGDSAWVWHADSIVLHGIAVALLFVLCIRLGAPFWIAFAASGLWALNVRLSEAVIWPAARGHQFAATCSLAALVLILGGWRHRRWCALLLLTLGLFAKETTLFAAAAIPFFLPDWRKERGFLVGLGALATGFVLLNVVLKDDLHTSGAGFAALLLKTPFILLRPLGLGDLYRFGWFSLALVAAAFLLALYLLRRGFGLAGLLWVLACSAPIVPLDKLSSRYLYLPAIGYTIVFCACWVYARELLHSEMLRRWIPLGLGVTVALIFAANVIYVQREIEDYALLSEPYSELADQVARDLAELPEGTLGVIDAAPQTTVASLTHSVQERGNIVKLIPYRRHAIDGLIELPDLLNVARPRHRGRLARPVASAEDPTVNWFVYDGERFRPAETPEGIPIEHVHRAAWGNADAYFKR